MIKILTPIILMAVLISGCVSAPKKTNTDYTNSITQYMEKGKSLENEGLYTSALKQYKLALTIDPENKKALQHKDQIESKLWKKAQAHYKMGLEFDKQGKHESARKEYLSALQNWPNYKAAQERLTPGGVVDESSDYIIHKLMYGESVSKLSMIYYGDFKKYSTIGKFNVLKDVTKVRVGDKLKIPVIEGVSLLDLKQKHENYLLSREADNAHETDDNIPPVETVETVETKPLPEEYPDPEPDIILPPGDDTKDAETASVEEESKEMMSSSEEASQPELEEKSSDDYAKGVQLFNQKKYTESIPLLLAAAKVDPDNEILTDYLFRSHFQQALILFNAENFLTAKDNFESALKYDEKCEKCPDYIEKCETTYKEKHYNLGIHYFGKEQLEKAIKEWNLVKNIDPDYKEVTPNLQKAEMLFKRLESIKKSTP